jgi:hypothetical protein
MYWFLNMYWGKCQHICHVHGRDKITLENNSATSEMACHKEKRSTIENNRLSYHID